MNWFLETYTKNYNDLTKTITASKADRWLPKEMIPFLSGVTITTKTNCP